MAPDDDAKTPSEHVNAWSTTIVEAATARASTVPSALGDEAPVSVQPLELHRALEVIGEIGQGGMGAINKSLDPLIGRHVAMKTLHSDVGDDDEEANRFIEEAQVTGQLEHPNVVPVYALSRDEDNRLFFTMKLVRGQTLAELLTEMGDARLEMQNLERLVEIVIKVCDAVAFAHSRGVIHRDIKPQYLMIGSFGQVYVMDWGIAALSRSPRLTSDENKMLGTPAFMAPEQARGRDVAERADVYGIGGLLYVILTAQHPHRGESLNALLYELMTEEVEAPAKRVPTLVLPPELCRISQKAMSLRQADRYATVAELREELVAFQRGGGWLATRHFSAGEIVYRQGDDAEEAFVIMDGQCEAFHDEDGEREVLRRLGPSDILGEVALLSGGTRAATVQASCDMTVRVVTRSSLARELERNGWMKALFDGVAVRFRELEKLLRTAAGEEGAAEREDE
jgi:serine/threonine-protein kinase